MPPFRKALWITRLPETRVRALHFLSLIEYMYLYISDSHAKNSGHTGAKTEFNVKWPLKVIQGHRFWGQLKANKRLHIAKLKSSKNTVTKSTENSFSTTALSFDAPLQKSPGNIYINLISPETGVTKIHFCCLQYGSVFIHIFVVGSKNNVFWKKQSA